MRWIVFCLIRGGMNAAGCGGAAATVIPSEVARWLCVRRATDEESAVAVVVIRSQREAQSGRIAIRPYVENSDSVRVGLCMKT